jgi:hypothetical protein
MQRVDSSALVDAQAVSFGMDSITDTLGIVADEMESLRRRIASTLLRFEMIGIADDEVEELKLAVEVFKRLCECLAWRPA